MRALPALRAGDAVEFLGEDLVLRVYRGHPGRVVDVEAMPSEVSVSFVNGPSLACSPEEVRQLAEADYVSRGRRLVSLLHPLEDRAVSRFNAEGDEWPEGRIPAQ